MARLPKIPRIPTSMVDTLEFLLHTCHHHTPHFSPRSLDHPTDIDYLNTQRG